MTEDKSTMVALAWAFIDRLAWHLFNALSFIVAIVIISSTFKLVFGVGLGDIIKLI